MGDYNITKKALAAALQELMGQMPFEKIKISDICEKCGLNRKSFYYHFKDKYDLVNWIFDIEFFQEISKPEYYDANDFLSNLCRYFYDNRDFYRRAMRIEGQNSFQEHFREMTGTLLEQFLKNTMPDIKNSDFYIMFYTDAIVGAFVRWLESKECMPPEQFQKLLENSINLTKNTIRTRRDPAE